MRIKADYHMHSYYSVDCNTPIEDMIQGAIQKGLEYICITEHMDYDFPVTDITPEGVCRLNVRDYLKELSECQEKYADQIKINFGVELGVQPHLTKRNTVFIKQQEYDFVIASSHVFRGMNPAHSPEMKNYSDDVLYRMYFEDVLCCMQEFQDFDVYGHIDYVVRYGRTKDQEYTFRKYGDLFDEMIRTLISKEKGIEINTSGIRNGLREMHPTMEFLRKYRERGGEIITVGSDAHVPEAIATGFDKAAEILKESGFNYYCTFAKRTPMFHKL